jgi:hypothetical protein
MYVDEPWRNDETVRVDHASGSCPWSERPDRYDPVATNRDVAEEPGIARAVDDPAAANEKVERLLGLGARVSG